MSEEQEPVAWVNIEAWRSGEYCADDCFSNAPCAEDVPLYTAPPQRPLLTDEEIAGIANAARWCDDYHMVFARAIERKVRGEE